MKCPSLVIADAGRSSTCFTHVLHRESGGAACSSQVGSTRVVATGVAG